MISPRRYEEPAVRLLDRSSLTRNTLLVCCVAVLVVFWRESHVDFGKLAQGMPRVAGWLGQMLPPDTRDLPEVLAAAFETLAMATIGTLFALVAAVPLSLLAARNISPHPIVYQIARGILNLSRGTETLVFALIFTAAIGFGPFTGVLAIAFHMTGAIGKMLADVIEPADRGPLEAAALSGASRLKVLRYALLPDIMPNFIAVALYMWEFSVRTSTVLGIVGAGGIGQTLKNTIDLLDFPKMVTVLAIILLMVGAIDVISDFLRRRILQDRASNARPAPLRVGDGEIGRV
ncbi:phosphonate transport system permease protein [Enhydrobacter aerosaccus]|uniref:Phosphonate transport system permease protein n=1 Tax=Enhydrobacter aerosaccus TaxID=225324 RepID=A0A1T4RIN4_9HYPH|nr:phosphonate ABC transporter, permease protein PhnE [Enhydrobacter aerosaccus]SKA15656.1 phosphonate transport system permease protein [Enhydrobacter aerosaccus]